MESVARIITAKDYAKREGCSTVFERIQKLARVISQRGGAIIQIASPKPEGFAVMAEIEFGQWVARCKCGGVEMVDPGEPVFYCFGCANRENRGFMRPVIFPQDREEIERLVLERPVDDLRGLDDLDRAYQARPLLFAQVLQSDGSTATLPLSRSWLPGETPSELKRQNKAVYEWRAVMALSGGA